MTTTDVDYTQEYVPVEKFGKDHYSTLAYLETVAVDANGKIHTARMRCNPRVHRLYAYDTGLGIQRWDPKYGTVLKDKTILEDHDDWSCLEDMANAGWLIIVSEGERKPGEPFTLSKKNPPQISLTPKGFAVAAALRQHRANGGAYRDFTPPIV